MGNWELTEDSFNLFLSQLDPDRETAGQKYELIRRRLVAMFESRGCVEAEELADETLNRFIRRLPAMVDSFNGDPVPYLLVIARHLHLEHIKKRTLPLPEDVSERPAPGDEERREAELFHACLEKCLAELNPEKRELVLDYYRGEKQAKRGLRTAAAKRLELTANALRIKVHRIRNVLHECVEACLERELPEMK